MSAFADLPLMQQLLLEQPWPIVIALLALAVGLTLVGRRQNNRWLRMSAWVVAIVAGAIVGLAWQIQTPREQLMANTHQILAATESPIDLADLDTWLAPTVILTGPDGEPWMERDEIIALLERLEQRDAIESHDIDHVEAETTRTGRGLTRLALRTQLSGGGRYGPTRTTWQLRWHRNENKTWRVHEIQWVSFNDRKPMRAMLWPRRRHRRSPFF